MKKVNIAFSFPILSFCHPEKPPLTIELEYAMTLDNMMLLYNKMFKFEQKN